MLSTRSKTTPPAKPSTTPSPLQFFKGVGPARAEVLARMGIHTQTDLVMNFPRDWQDRRLRFTIQEAPLGERITLKGKILSVQFSSLRQQLGMASAIIQDPTGILKAVWFKKTNYRYDVFATLRERLQPGACLMVFGLFEFGLGGKQLRVEEMAFLPSLDDPLSEEDALHLNRIVPLYTVPEGLNERLLRSLVAKALVLKESLVPITPESVVQKRRLPSKAWSLEKIHFPGTLLEKETARTALAFEEFLVLETALGLLRRTVKQKLKPQRYFLRRNLLTPFREHLGFQFTAAQKRVIREIFDDMMTPFPMNRLLQGDVGSGKTLVALSAMLLAVENSGQAALMVPTEILAEQHALTFSRFLKQLDVQWAVLVGRQKSSQRTKLLEAIASGKLPLVIGTHAVIQKHVNFKNLTLVVIDEQHRFGVEHRTLLREKGTAPDVLVMTATPIPRTLALTVYGDLDVSTIQELPPGRTPVATFHVSEEEAYRRLQATLRSGQQAYMIFPLVEESSKVELKAVVQEAEKLSCTVFQNVRVGVLHGQLPSDQKERIMSQFRSHELDLLIATSIIEVGIDVPNATMIVIQHAERFGLATLHQLRGRVGRGPLPSQCLLVAEVKQGEARRRIETMTQTTDGFRLSEEDLAMRGPGEVLGEMQHGLPIFKAGNLVHDAALIQEARHAANELLAQDPLLKKSEHRALKNALQQDYSAKWALGRTG